MMPLQLVDEIFSLHVLDFDSLFEAILIDLVNIPDLKIGFC